MRSISIVNCTVVEPSGWAIIEMPDAQASAKRVSAAIESRQSAIASRLGTGAVSVALPT